MKPLHLRKNNGKHFGNITSINELVRNSSQKNAALKSIPPLNLSNNSVEKKPGSFPSKSQKQNYSPTNHFNMMSNLQEASENQLGKITSLQRPVQRFPSSDSLVDDKDEEEDSFSFNANVETMGSFSRPQGLEKNSSLKPLTSNNMANKVFNPPQPSETNSIGLGSPQRKPDFSPNSSIFLDSKPELNQVKPNESHIDRANKILESIYSTDLLRNLGSSMYSNEENETDTNSILLNDLATISETHESEEKLKPGVNIAKNSGFESVDKAVVDFEMKAFKNEIEKHKFEIQQAKTEIKSQASLCQQAFEEVKNQQNKNLKLINEKVKKEFSDNENEILSNLNSKFDQTEKYIISCFEEKIENLKDYFNNEIKNLKDLSNSKTKEQIKANEYHSTNNVEQSNLTKMSSAAEMNDHEINYDPRHFQSFNAKLQNPRDKIIFSHLSQIKLDIEYMKSLQEDFNLRLSSIPFSTKVFPDKHDEALLDTSRRDRLYRNASDPSYSTSKPLENGMVFKDRNKAWEEDEQSLNKARGFLAKRRHYLTTKNRSNVTKHDLLTTALQDSSGSLVEELLRRHDLKEKSSTILSKIEQDFFKREKLTDRTRSVDLLTETDKPQSKTSQDTFKEVVEMLHSVDGKMNKILQFTPLPNHMQPGQAPSSYIHDIISNDINQKLFYDWRSKNKETPSYFNGNYVSGRELMKLKNK